MKKDTSDFIHDLSIPVEVMDILVPHASIEIYNKENLERVLGGKRVLIIGSGFESRDESNGLRDPMTISKELASELIKHKDITVMSGCCADSSIPSMVIEQLKELDPNYPSFGISRYDKLPLAPKYANLSKLHDVILYNGYTGMNLPKRYEFALADFVHVMVADYVIAIHGSIGTNHEVSIAYELQKPIGFITGCGGVTDIHPQIVSAINDEGRKNVKAFSDENPKTVLDWLLSQ